MIIETYLENIKQNLGSIVLGEKENISVAAQRVAETIKSDGIIYIFGCGHSHLVALDSFYRAGGLANVSAVLDTDLMLHNGAAKSSRMEKMPGIAEGVFERYCMTEADTFIVVSTSGKNAVPVEMAEMAQKNNVPTIGIASSEYLADRQDGKTMLKDTVDIYINNFVPHGDASIDFGFSRMGSLSTYASSFIVQSIILEAVDSLTKEGYTDIPVYMSGNVEGGSEYNRQIIKKFLPRIKHL